jgi:hypothetical protein
MPKRPLIQKGVTELERLFDERREDSEFLDVLAAELSERRVQRAQELKRRVIEAIDAMSKRTPSTARPKAAPAAAKPPPPSVVSAKTELEARAPVVEVGGLQQRPLLDTSAISSPRPPTNNKPDHILSAWTAMEVLSPPSFRNPAALANGARDRIATFGDSALPWEGVGEKSRPNQRLYYQVVLGSIDMEVAVSALLHVYSDTRIERPQARGEAVLATIMVDRSGRPVQDDAVAISSFGWGVPIALTGRLDGLGQWSAAEKVLIEGLTKKITVEDEGGNPRPLTHAIINTSFDWLVDTLGLGGQLVKPPAFAVRSYQYFKVQDAPESILLNSFYLDDLARARILAAESRTPPNLQRYLGIVQPKIRRNLMNDPIAISDALEPAKFPLGSWPGNGRHPLAMLQQCAVNLATHDLKVDGILAVNGPPGTGKTTLLRDVIAAIVTSSAEILCSYADPEQAFHNSGQRIRRGNSFVHLYSLDAKLRGQEIIVASSNNKAVENISAELPGIDAIASDATGLRYFKTVSDAMLGRETWGAVAAVLGNAKNRNDFRQTFWWDDDAGLRRYLQHVSGTPQFIIEKTEYGTRQRPPHIVVQEDAPEDHEEALRRWRKARQRFDKLLADTKAAMAVLQRAHDLLRSIRQKQNAIADMEARTPAMKSTLRRVSQAARDAALAYQEAANAADAVVSERQGWRVQRPGFLARILRLKTFRLWQEQDTEIVVRQTEAERRLPDLKEEMNAKNTEHARWARTQQDMEASQNGLRSKLSQETSALDQLRREHPGTFISEEFFELGHREKQKAAPWLDKRAASLRNDLFESAMTLRRAFVDAAAKPIRHNLTALMDSFGTRSLGNSDKDKLVPHLWSTLFLIVPAISTTFASISRMFTGIDPSEFGWLLVDEAGQALPQAAVGALMRTQRAIVVGDPIQIEPVVVLPDRLTEAMCQQFGVDSLLYNAPSSSVQTLADSATEYFGSFETRFGTREVGVPLLVHRRCDEPMFSISNAIAYENQMVQAKAPRNSPIRNVLGSSRWIHIEGHGQEKWCQQEGKTVMNLVRQLRTAGCAADFYIITPFVVVQDRMRELLRTSGVLDGWVEKPDAWVYERIGTVHTVQGREAEAVFFVLGAPEDAQRGARAWAGGRPNLLNVAVTRAQDALYVVGNRKLWKTAGIFQTLDEYLGAPS